MRRHLLALFALFSGIAALQAPAHASALDSMVSATRAQSHAGDAAASEQCVCRAQRQQSTRRCSDNEAGFTPRRLLEIIGLPVIIGSDRALE